MHILEIPSFFIPYGGGFCLDQAKALRGQGHQVRILSNIQLSVKKDARSFLSLPYTTKEEMMDGILVVRHFQRGIPMVIRPNVNRWVRTVQRMFRDYIVKYGKPDVIHAHCAKWAGYAAMLISKTYDIPYVVTEHLSRMSLETEFGEPPSDAWQIAILRKTYQCAGRVLPVAEEVVTDTACYYGADYRWEVVSNVIDTALFHYQSRKPLADRPFVFCCLANYDYRKGYDVLASAFREVKARESRVELYVAGDGTDSKPCRRLLDMEGVRIFGLLDRHEVAQLLYQSDALVLASRDEVQPLAVLEAMSTGIPVVTTDTVPKSLRDTDGCHTVPVDDAKALASEMLNVCWHTDYNGRAFSEWVRRTASPEVIGARLSEIFAEAQQQTP